MLTLAPALLLSCDGGAIDEPVELNVTAQAITCTTNAGFAMVDVSAYVDGSHGLSKDFVEKYYRATGKQQGGSACTGAYVGNSYYLSAGGCGYATGQQIKIGTSFFSILSVDQKNEANWNYAILTLGGTADLDLNEGSFRMSNVNAIPGDKIGAFAVNAAGTYRFVGGTVHSNGTNNRFNHRLDTPVPYSKGAPIVNEAGFLVGIHTEDTCTSASLHNRAMMVDKILSNSVPLRTMLRTQPCTGNTKPGATTWTQQGTDVIFTDVNTAACGYNDTPSYYTSLGGGGGHYNVNGVNAIYNRTTTGFRVYLDGPGITPALATSANWHINWQAFQKNWNDVDHLYRCSIFSVGANSWNVSSTRELWQNFTIPPFCNTVAPRNFYTSITGTEWHRDALGVNAIYNKSASVFRLYLDRAAGITPAQAASRSWAIDINVANELGSVRQEKVGSTTSAQHWQPFNVGTDIIGVYIDVPTNTGWNFTPRYFASLVSNRASSSLVRGTSSIYAPTKNGFRLYVTTPTPRPNDTPVTPALADIWWKVDWVARP